MAENEQEQNAGTSVPPENMAGVAVLPPAPQGFVWRFTGSGTPAMVREEDAAEWEAEHGVVAEQYDLEAAASQFNAAYAAFPDTVKQCVEEVGELGYVRADMEAALHANWGAISDAFTYLLRSIVNLHPTENQVADAAIGARDHGGSLDYKSDTPFYAKRYSHLIDRIPADRLKWHEDRSAADAAGGN